MIKKEDINVGLRFYITRNDCLKCGIDVLYANDSIPILFEIDEIDGHNRLRCTPVNLSNEFSVCFGIEDIMMYGMLSSSTHKTDNEKNGKSEQVNHPSHYAWLKDLCGVEPIEICQHFDFSVGNALKYIMRKGKVERNLTEKQQRIQDLEKAIYYLKNEIYLMKNDSNNKDNK